MVIYKNHSRKLEQHTHCHSFLRPFSLLTHHLTMSVTYSKTLNDDTPLWKRSKDENAPDSRPPTPPPPGGDRGIHSLSRENNLAHSLLLFMQVKASEFSAPPGQVSGQIPSPPICPTHTVLPFLKLSLLILLSTSVTRDEK